VKKQANENQPDNGGIAKKSAKNKQCHRKRKMKRKSAENSAYQSARKTAPVAKENINDGSASGRHRVASRIGCQHIINGVASISDNGLAGENNR
jgi:hypothetical protein